MDDCKTRCWLDYCSFANTSLATDITDRVSSNTQSAESTKTRKQKWDEGMYFNTSHQPRGAHNCWTRAAQMTWPMTRLPQQGRQKQHNMNIRTLGKRNLSQDSFKNRRRGWEMTIPRSPVPARNLEALVVLAPDQAEDFKHNIGNQPEAEDEEPDYNDSHWCNDEVDTKADVDGRQQQEESAAPLVPVLPVDTLLRWLYVGLLVWTPIKTRDGRIHLFSSIVWRHSKSIYCKVFARADCWVVD